MSVRDYGAIGDGVSRPLSARFATLAAAQAVYPFVTSLSQTQDWAGCQAAINYAQSLRSAVYLPRGTYKLGSSGLLVTIMITIYGDGHYQSLLSAAGNIDILYCDIASANDRGLVLRDFGIANKLAYASLTSGAGLRTRLAYCASIENLRITGCYTAFDIVQSSIMGIKGLLIEGFKNRGFWAHGGSNFDIRMSNFTIGGSNGLGPTGVEAIRFDDMCDEFLFGNGIVSSAQFAMVTGAAVYSQSQRPAFARFNNVSFDNNDYGPDLNHCFDFVFDGCFFSNRVGYGLRIGHAQITEGVRVVNSTFLSNDTNGAEIHEFARYTTLSNNIVGNNSARTVGVSHGFVAFEDAADFIITGNEFGNGFGGSGFQNYGLLIAHASCNRFVVSSNIFTANGGVLVNNSAGAEQEIHGNIGYRTKASGTAKLIAGTRAQPIKPGFPSADYKLMFSSNAAGETLSWSAKTASGFTITSNNPSSTAQVDWTASL